MQHENNLQKYLDQIHWSNKMNKKSFFTLFVLLITSFTFAQNNNLAFIYGGFLMIFGFSFGKIFTFSALAFQAFLVASPRVAQDDFGFCSALAYLSLLGLTLHV